MANLLDDQRIYEVTVVGQDDDQAVVNVFHYLGRDNNAAENPSMGAFLLKFQTKWIADVLPNVSTNYEVLFYEIKRINEAFSRAITNIAAAYYWFGYDEQDALEAGAGEKGTLIGDSFPTFVAVNLRKVSAIRSRSFRGSTRIGPLVENDTDATPWNEFNDAAKTRHRELAQKLPASIDVTDTGEFWMDMVIASRKKAWENFEGNDWWSLVVRMVASDLVTTQNSRKKRFNLG